MSWKINRIDITNFKGFYGKHSFDLEGKNLLVYGENGSGKSSLYWSLYTHMQSCLKTQDTAGAGKYFDPKNDQNLRNRFCKEDDLSDITVEFINTQTKLIQRYTISNKLINTAIANDFFMYQTLGHSDFLNYKFLYSLFDFKNSQDVDLFDIFLNSIFPCADFADSLVDLDGRDRRTTNMKDWWDYITKEAPTTLKKGNKFKHNYVRGDARYYAYWQLIRSFNELMRAYVQQITYQANELLKHDLYLPVQINLKYNDLDFDRPCRVGSRIHDGKIYIPTIYLTANIVNPNIKEKPSAQVTHPQSFFNEAKLARMALAIRLSVINAKGGADGPGAHVLCIDDMMISLDMSNRLDVIDYILNQYKDFQLIVLTHDRALYRLFQSKIQFNQHNWIQKEMYATDEGVEFNIIPNVMVLNQKSNVDIALKEFREYNYPGCANALRRECERLLEQLLPSNMKLDRNGEKFDLSKYISKLKEFYDLYRLPNLMPNIDIYREHILNPLSHDDLTSNVFRRELEKCMEDIRQLSKCAPKYIIVNEDELPADFNIEMEHAGNSCSITFRVKDVWDYILLDDKKYYRNLQVEILSSTSPSNADGQNRDIFVMHQTMGAALRIPNEELPTLGDVVQRVSDGKRLKDL